MNSAAIVGIGITGLIIAAYLTAALDSANHPPRAPTPAVATAQAAPVVNLPLLHMHAYADRSPRTQITLGNGSNHDISYISGRFVTEEYYGKAWHASADLGMFSAEIVPPHGYRHAITLGGGYLVSDGRVRIVRIDRCIVDGRDIGTACMDGLISDKPREWQNAVVYQPQ